MIRKDNAITLIALVITIIVLLILAAVSISAVIGENGIANKAKDAKLETRAGEVQELVDIWKTENYASRDVEWEDVLTEDELLLQLIDSGKVKESEINRQSKIIKIGTREIDYSIKNTGVFGILYGYGELLPYTPAPNSYSYDLESEYSDLIYFINEDENISQLDAEYYYEYYELCFNTTGKIEETEDRVYVCTVDYAEASIYDLDNVVLYNRIDIITFEEKIQPTYISFYHVENVVFNNFEYLDTSKITDMSKMFRGCYTVSLDLSGFDTSNVTNMSQMFYYSQIGNLDVTGFNTANVTNMHGMFSGCDTIQNLDLSMWNMNNVTDTGSMFQYCDLLETVILPESLTVIGNSCFSSSALREITIHDSVTSIGRSAFSYCGNLTDVNISLDSNLETIEAYAFCNCDNLTNITLPDSLTTIGDRAFSGGCSNLNNLFIPASVQTMGEDVFYYVSSLSLRCGATAKPSGWHTDWKLYTVSVSWGQTR